MRSNGRAFQVVEVAAFKGILISTAALPRRADIRQSMSQLLHSLRVTAPAKRFVQSLANCKAASKADSCCCWARFAIAVLIIVIGRLVLKIEGRGDFLIDISRCWNEGCF